VASLCATAIVSALDVVGVPEPAPSRVRRDGDLAVRKQRAGAMPLIVVFGFLESLCGGGHYWAQLLLPICYL